MVSTSSPANNQRPQWPREANEAYEPTKPLGQGGFGSVWMARRRNKIHEKRKSEDEYVAIKMVKGSVDGTTATVEAQYARREINILSEINHPNIVRFIEAFDGKATNDSAPSSAPQGCIVLSLARGPTLETLLNHGGALGVPIARSISIQLLSAVAHLHGHAVIHRDIKPDNIIVTGANVSSSECWSDDIEGVDAMKKGKWHVTLIDFGFARALSSSEMKENSKQRNDDSQQMSASAAVCAAHVDESLIDESVGRSRGRPSDVDVSVSKRRVRNLSALGNRHYAAPEVVRGAREGRSTQMKAEKREALAKCVSDYALVADAFSVGATMRYMLTGVPPDVNVEEFLAMQSSPFAVVARLLGKVARKASSRKKGEKQEDQRKKIEKRYKRGDELPKDATVLVRALTHWDPHKRLTVRAARSYPWVQQEEDTSEGQKDSQLSLSQHGGKIQHLRCCTTSTITCEE